MIDVSGMVDGAPRVWLRLEGALLLLLAVSAYAALDGPWLWFGILFFAPDLSFAGYLAGPRAGAQVYNAAHSLAGPWLLALAGVAGAGVWLLPAAALWAGHVGFDRMLGYGLKYPSAFVDTHLGRIGNAGRGGEVSR